MIDSIVTSETFQYFGDSVHGILLGIINKIFNGEPPPSQSRSSIIIPIAKKVNLTLMTNYQGICLISIAAKLFNKMLLNQIREIIDPNLN